MTALQHVGGAIAMRCRRGSGTQCFALALAERLPSCRAVVLGARVGLARPLTGHAPPIANSDASDLVQVWVRPPGGVSQIAGSRRATALKSRAKKAKHFATRERAAILLASNVGTFDKLSPVYITGRQPLDHRSRAVTGAAPLAPLFRTPDRAARRGPAHP